MTTRLDLRDPELRTWDATVLDSVPDGIVLDRSAFYPGGGGQPPDDGALLWCGVTTRVVGSRRGSDVVLIPHEDDPLPPSGTVVRGVLDDARRTSLMRTHSGLHVLAAVIARDFGAPVTGSAMEPGAGRLDIDLPEPPPGLKQSLEQACNEVVDADLAVRVRLVPAAQAYTDPELSRSAESRLPSGLTTVRVVEIVGLDRQADAGTHVASTKAIGHVRIAKVESKGRGARRIRLGL